MAAALLGLQHDVHQLFGLGLVQQVGTLLLQLVQQAVVGGVHGEYFLLCKAEDVVIERSAFVDLAACQLDVCGLVHDDGRVACTGTDALLPLRSRAFTMPMPPVPAIRRILGFAAILSTFSMVGSRVMVMRFAGPPASMMAVFSACRQSADTRFARGAR